jgi:hypothetical protein
MSVSFAIDAKLLSTSIHDARDDITIQTLSLTAFPLVVQSKDCFFLPLGCNRWITSNNTISFHLREDSRFEDGTVVLAEHYVATWNEIVSNRNHPLFDVTRMLGKLYVVSQFRLEFWLRSPQLLNESICLLSSSYMSPLHPTNRLLAAGAYRLASVAGHQWSFVANQKNPLWQQNLEGAIEKLNAILIQNHLSAVEAFSSGAIALTCDTQFPVDGFKRWERSGFLCEGRSRVFISLLPDALPFPEEREFWDLLKQVVSLQDLSMELGNVVTPFSQTLSQDLSKEEYENLLSDWKARISKQGRIAITVAYDDFYPNLEILKLLRTRLSCFGIDILPEQDDYYAPWRKCHLRLRLWSPQLQSRFGLFLAIERNLCLPKGSPERRLLLEQALSPSSLQQIPGNSVLIGKGGDFTQKLQASVLGMHLFSLRNVSLRESTLNHGQFRPGFIWKREPKEAHDAATFSEFNHTILPVSGTGPSIV